MIRTNEILSPQQKAANTRARNKFLKALRETRDLYRRDHRALAGAIARNIRADNHANESAEYFDNGAFHWYQQSWGQFKFDPAIVTKVENRWRDNLWEISCPTTGCV